MAENWGFKEFDFYDFLFLKKKQISPHLTMSLGSFEPVPSQYYLIWQIYQEDKITVPTLFFPIFLEPYLYLCVNREKKR